MLTAIIENDLLRSSSVSRIYISKIYTKARVASHNFFLVKSLKLLLTPKFRFFSNVLFCSSKTGPRLNLSETAVKYQPLRSVVFVKGSDT